MNKYIVEYKEGWNNDVGLPYLRTETINADSMKIENGMLVFYDCKDTIIYVFNMEVFVKAWLHKEPSYR